MAWGVPNSPRDKNLEKPFQNIAFWNGLRVMLTMLVPITVGMWMGYPEQAFMLGLGALVMGICDIPGTVIHRRNGMIVGFFILVISNGIVAASTLNPFLNPIVLVVLSFFLSYLALYGQRASIIGAAGMLAMIFGLFVEPDITSILLNPLMIAGGAAFYFLLSLILMQLRPYRIVKQLLGESVIDIGDYIQERAHLYDVHTDNNLHFQNLMRKQVHINEEQENIRELLLKNRKVQKGLSHHGQALAMIFSESVDMFELAFAAHFDYDRLKKIFKNSDKLIYFYNLINLLGQEISYIGECIAEGKYYKPKHPVQKKIEALRFQLTKWNYTSSNVEEVHDINLLSNVLDHMEIIFKKCMVIKQYHNRENKTIEINFTKLRLHLFTRQQSYSLRPFLTNFSWKSTYFKHAVRTAIAFAVGIGLSFLVPHHKSYWILLTIAIILRSNYSSTRKKLNQRVIGTIAGAFIGFGIVTLPFFNNYIGISVLIIAAWGSFTFNVLNYRTSVIFTTIAVLIGNYYIEPDFISIVQFRIIDTLIGAGISLAALRLLWPDWESRTIAEKLILVLKANRNYIASIRKVLRKETDFKLEYKLARKTSLISNSELISTFQRMLDDPTKSRFQPSRVYNFSTLNYAFMSHTATLGSQLINKDIHNRSLVQEWLLNIEKIEQVLYNAEKIIISRYQLNELKSENITIDLSRTTRELDTAQHNPHAELNHNQKGENDKIILDYRILKNQLDHIDSLSKRILKQSEEFGKSLRSEGL